MTPDPGPRILVVEDDPVFQRLVCAALESRGLATVAVDNGTSALELLEGQPFELVLLDLGLPDIEGMDVLARLESWPSRPKVIVMTGDTTPEAILESVRTHAYQFVAKPVDVETLVGVAEDALAAPPPMPIELVSAKSDWVELLVPCQVNAPERVQSFLEQLEGDLPEETRESIGRAFRELLLNAIEWGGQWDPNRNVRISFLRAKRMLMYRIEDPGAGFRVEDLTHSAIHNPPGEPFRHVTEREEKGLRPGGFGLLMTRSLVDELIYNEAHNEVVFVKYLD